MRNQALLHDHAHAMAVAALEIIRPLLREEEQRDAFEMFYVAARSVLEDYETRMDRAFTRVKGG